MAGSGPDPKRAAEILPWISAALLNRRWRRDPDIGAAGRSASAILAAVQLTLLDWSIIAAYFALALGVGLYASRRAASSPSLSLIHI